ncbi:MAG: hypothetical protein LBR11_01680 [Deltaproteobacteria bacterium]|jgi:hypothetical protein|nr:hypothetical protein [Deltaproteobacteria bacterium]
MTAPLHHINQLYLHLPAINGQVAAQDAIGQELQRMARQAQDQEYRRDLVEVVAEAKPGVESGAINPGREPLTRASHRGQPRAQAQARSAVASPKDRQAPIREEDLLVDVRV